MFTGIIEELGTIENIKRGKDSAVLTIKASKVLEDASIGDSIAVNGICLTVTSISSGSFCADVMHETLRRSSLSDITSGSAVNLERAMAANGRFGGHIVAGHVDGTGRISGIVKDDNAYIYTIEAKGSILRYVVEKGSITIDGISLTVTNVTKSSLSVSVIPHTMSNTVLKDKKAGDIVNLETDIIGKYVEKLLSTAPEEEKSSGITMEFLQRNGF